MLNFSLGFLYFWITDIESLYWMRCCHNAPNLQSFPNSLRLIYIAKWSGTAQTEAWAETSIDQSQHKFGYIPYHLHIHNTLHGQPLATLKLALTWRKTLARSIHFSWFDTSSSFDSLKLSLSSRRFHYVKTQPSYLFFLGIRYRVCLQTPKTSERWP